MKQQNSRAMDLTEGNIVKQILLFSMPILVGNIFQTVYNNVDSYVVGNYVGKQALAAVNSCTPVFNLMVGFFIGMSTGASVVFSRALGAGDHKRLKRAIHTTVTVALIMGVILAIFGVLNINGILNILNTQPDVRQYAAEYLQIYIAGMMFTAFYNVGAAVLRSVGDSRSPFYALVISSLLNIVLDLMFVINFGLGVAGVALATVIAQIVSVIFVLFRMVQMDESYRFSFKDLCIDKDLIGEILSLGLPAGVQSSMISLSNMFVNRYTNSFSSELMAGLGVAQKLDRFCSMPIQSIGLALTTFVSQNLGAGKKKRVRDGIFTSLGMAAVTVIVSTALMLPFAPVLIGLFNKDPLVVHYGTQTMYYMLPLYFLAAVEQIMSGVLRGYKFSRQVMIIGLIGMVGMRQLYLMVFLSLFHTETVIYCGYPVGWFTSAMGMTTYYFYLKKTGKLDSRSTGK